MYTICRHVSLLALTLGLCWASAAQAQNLIPDPDFDTGVSHWTLENGSLSLDSSEGYPASPSAKGVFELNSGAWYFGARSDCINVLPTSGPYELSINYKTTPVNLQESVNANLAMFTGADCSGAQIQTGTNNPVALGNGWYQASKIGLTLESGTHSIAVDVLGAASQATAGGVAPVVHFDRVRLGLTGTTPVTLQSFQVN